MSCRKLIFISLLLILIAYPLPILATDNRGINIESSGISPDAYLGTYHALIIGINKYKEWNPLRTAVKDAEALKDILIQRYGFKKENVILRTDRNATRDGLIGDLRNMASGLGNRDNLLIYFAGHGQLDDLTGDGYWIPTEGKLKKPSSWISHSTIKNILSSERVRGKNIIIVADSCYSGTLLRGGPSLLSINEQGYRKKLLKLASNRSRQVITSGGLEPVTDGGRDGHSLFAYYFLKALKDNDRDLIDLENLFHTRVWRYVTEIGDQRPNVGRLKTPMDEDGQFVLVSSGAIVEEPVKTDKVNSSLDAERKRLEQERIELEKLKTEFERKKIDAERERIEKEKQKYASISPDVSKPNFIKYATGVVYDKNTGLEWYVGPDKNTNWNEAKRWVENLTVAGGGWRMPTRKELRTLYKKGAGERNMTPLLKTTGWWVWSGETKGSSPAWVFAFNYGRPRPGPTKTTPTTVRGFAMRSRITNKDTDDITKNFNGVEIGRDGRFIAYDNGTVLDIKTGLMWASKDNGEDINWKDAKKYCENYRSGGYTDWRMPTWDELAGIYNKNRSGYKQDCGSGSQYPKIKLTKLIYSSFAPLKWRKTS